MPELKHRILDYLVQVPEAGDTAQGIAEWWLLEQRIVNALMDVQRALGELIREGWVRKLERTDGHVHYRVRAERLEEIRDVLQAALLEPMAERPQR